MIVPGTTPLVHPKTGLKHLGVPTHRTREMVKRSAGWGMSAANEDVGYRINEEFRRCAHVLADGATLTFFAAGWRPFYDWWSGSGVAVKWLVLQDRRGWYVLTDVTRTLRDNEFRLHMFEPEFFRDCDAAIMAGVLRL